MGRSKRRGASCAIVLVTLLAVFVECDEDIYEICRKFNIGGPCLLLPHFSETIAKIIPPDPWAKIANPFCRLACAGGWDHIPNTFCECTRALDTTAPPATSTAPTTSTSTTTTTTTTSTTTTTTTPTTTTTTTPTTTPRPEKCYYTLSRPAQLGGSSIRKRLYSPTQASMECQYPGVVGLFQMEEENYFHAQCMATLLEEDLILVDAYCQKLIQAITLYAMADSYQTSNVSSRSPHPIAKTIAPLDKLGMFTDLYTVRLSAPVQFDDKCAQPACVPNEKIHASDINFSDCRFVGYGAVGNDFGTALPQHLMEIKVTVDPSSVRSATLTVIRPDLGTSAGPCFYDFGSSLICSHVTTREWITIGVTYSVGFPCSSAAFTQVKVANLLQEALYHNYYNSLQQFKYTEL